MPMRLKTPMPSLEGVTEWVHGQPDPEELKGQPVLIYFWATSCHICHENMPKLQAWRDLYVPKGLKMISIHCPRMKTDTDMEKVKASIDECGIIESCGIDNMHRLKKAFDNDLWPAYFLFDKEGNLKRRAAGNAGLGMLQPILTEMFT
jgi:thiol-disulfide isomerase/thioredoxin